MTGDHRAVHGNAATGVHQHRIADSKRIGINLRIRLAGAADRNRTRQEVQEITDRTPTARYRHALEHFGDQYEQGDHQTR